MLLSLKEERKERERKKNDDGDEERAQGDDVVFTKGCGLRGMECTSESSTCSPSGGHD